MSKLPQSWITFQGREVTLETIDHQHLSNAYWFLRIYHQTPIEELSEFQEVLDRRFNGQLLPYRPHSAFREEIRFLRDKNMLRRKSHNHYEIEWNGDVIGEVRTLEDRVHS